MVDSMAQCVPFMGQVLEEAKTVSKYIKNHKNILKARKDLQRTVELRSFALDFSCSSDTHTHAQESRVGPVHMNAFVCV